MESSPLLKFMTDSFAEKSGFSAKLKKAEEKQSRQQMSHTQSSTQTDPSVFKGAPDPFNTKANAAVPILGGEVFGGLVGAATGNETLAQVGEMFAPDPLGKLATGLGALGMIRSKPYYHGTRKDFEEHEEGLIFLTDSPSTAGSYAIGGGGQRGTPKYSLLHDYYHDKTYTYQGVDEWGFPKVQDPKTKEVFVYDEDTQMFTKEGIPDFQGIKYTEDFGYTPEYEKWLDEAKPMHKEDLEAIPEGSNIRRYYPDTKKTLDLQHKGYDKNGKALNEGTAILAGVDPKGNKWATIIVNNAKQGTFDWSTTKYPEAQKAWKDIIIPQLKAKGYDSVEYWDDMHQTLAVFDNKQLKTSIPRLKTQDPKVQDDSLLIAARMLEQNGKPQEAAILRGLLNRETQRKKIGEKETNDLD
jgi:hypothetical protein